MTVAAEFELGGKVFVVVGASRGIGRGIAEVLAESGCDGAAVSRTGTHLLPTVDRIAKATGRNITGIVADATSTAEMDAVFKSVMEKFGRIDIWVNAVGDDAHAPLVPLPQGDGTISPAEPLSDAEFRHILDLNFTSTHTGCRAVGAYFTQRGSGRVINIGSVLGRFAGKGVSTYVAAKAGMEGFTRALALEWGAYGVTVNCIAPGSFPDPEFMTSEGLDERHAQAREIVPLQRSGTLREAGLLVAFLASDAAAYITGQTLYLDGGLALGRL